MCNLLVLFFQKLIVVEMQLNAFSGDINKVILIKTTLKQVKLIWQCNEQFFKHFKPSKRASTLLCLHAYNLLCNAIIPSGTINSLLPTEILTFLLWRHQLMTTCL